VLNLTLDPQQFSGADAERMLNLIVTHLLEYADKETLEPFNESDDGRSEAAETSDSSIP
jgi:hypothetical protein